MQRKYSVHINRNCTPGFDFLKTSQIPSTPQPHPLKQKKMFLALYRTLKTPIPELEYINVFKKPIKKPHSQNALIVESLVPVPIKNRVLNRSFQRKFHKPIEPRKNIKINFHAKKSSPVPSNFDENSLWSYVNKNDKYDGREDFDSIHNH
jgi:hypothetical protein